MLTIKEILDKQYDAMLQAFCALDPGDTMDPMLIGFKEDGSIEILATPGFSTVQEKNIFDFVIRKWLKISWRLSVNELTEKCLKKNLGNM